MIRKFRVQFESASLWEGWKFSSFLGLSVWEIEKKKVHLGFSPEESDIDTGFIA